MNEEITQVQDTVLPQVTESYDEDSSMDEDISMDGTHQATSLPLGESIDQMGDLLDPEQVDDDDQIDIDIARNVIKLRITTMNLIWTLQIILIKLRMTTTI